MDDLAGTGIYVRKHREISGEELVEAILNRRSIGSWLENWLQKLAEIIQPHVFESNTKLYPSSLGEWVSLNLGDDWKYYRIAEEFSGQVTENQVRDAIECMNEVRILMRQVNCEDDTLDGDLGLVINAAFKLGYKSERMQIRAFEPYVRERKNSLVALKKINSKNNRQELKKQATEALKRAEKEHPNRGRVVQIQKAAESIGIKERAFRNRLKF